MEVPKQAGHLLVSLKLSSLTLILSGQQCLYTSQHKMPANMYINTFILCTLTLLKVGFTILAHLQTEESQNKKVYSPLLDNWTWSFPHSSRFSFLHYGTLGALGDCFLC